MNIINISENKRILKSIAYGSFLFGNFFGITTAAHASFPGTIRTIKVPNDKLRKSMESRNIEEISRQLAAIGDEKAQIDDLLGPSSQYTTWPILFMAAEYEDPSVLAMLLALFRNHPEYFERTLLMDENDPHSTLLNCASSSFQWQRKDPPWPQPNPNKTFGTWQNGTENALDLLLGTAKAAKIFSGDASKKAFKGILMREIDRSGGDPLIRLVGKHFGPELEAELIKYKRQFDEFPADCRLPPWQRNAKDFSRKR
jgi:hypothetical protein